jgi:hypothetical protein
MPSCCQIVGSPVVAMVIHISPAASINSEIVTVRTTRPSLRLAHSCQRWPGGGNWMTFAPTDLRRRQAPVTAPVGGGELGFDAADQLGAHRLTVRLEPGDLELDVLDRPCGGPRPRRPSRRPARGT